MDSAPLARDSAPDEPLPPLTWKLNVGLFCVTVISVFYAGAGYVDALRPGATWREVLLALPRGYGFAIPLLAILLTHEFGHFFAARYHKVDASLPFFIPLPMLSPFGTMGAVISMRGRIKSRNALLDIGASGPLAGLAVAIPVLIYGLAHSKVGPLSEHGAQEGQSLFYLLMKRIILGPIPAGHDVFLNPVAFAGWSGLFVTALNLIPIAQLDGGHIAYALFGLRQNRLARRLHVAMLLMFLYNAARFILPVLLHRSDMSLGTAFGNSLFWLFWFGMIHGMMRVSGRDHPPTEPGELSPTRRWLAILSLVFFVLLFMPTPFAEY